MGRRAAALFTIAATLAVPSAVAQVVLAPTVFHRANLPPGAATTFVVACPGGYVAPSGGVFTPAQGTTLLGSKPTGNRAFEFRFGNPRPNAARRVTVAVACRKVRTGGAVLKLTSVRPKTILVAPGRQRSAALACPSGLAPAGAGIDLDPGRRSGSAGSKLSVRRLTEDLHRFSFVVRNAGKAARAVTFSGNCVTLVSSSGTPRERLHVKVSTFSALLQPGRHHLARSCPPGWFSLAAGYALPNPLAAIEAAGAVRRGGQWWLASTAKGPVAITLQLACGRISAG
jgi:hypothetical protein